ncbi:MAG TPA: transglycosylase SLT domain-containing protein, partial [Rhodanobacteraceae bacterium]|nr:transglycosylase SLT domain-containing protein [Rhodanobacteraceae bacterium]
YAATSYAPDAARKLDALPAAATTDTTREWRVRLALVAGDWRKVLDALDALSAEQQSDEVWRYWRARALAERGQDAASRAAFATIAGNADFYGFLAADWLGQRYVICADQLVGSVAEDATLLRVAPLDRAFELKAIGLEAPARREWAQAMGELDADQQRLAADLATRRGWYSRAIVTLNSGTNRRLYDLRYPLAYRQAMEGNATTAGIEPAWAFAIARAESAWIPDARSGANARGLMQLLPATAREVAKRDNLPYRHAADLYDPAINIPLGTHYLARMAARYQGAPWLASAAYNAGAGNVGRWLDARGTLAPDVFVASIPFNETRAYVRRVMAYTVIYDWRLHGAAEPLSARMPRIGEAYAPSDTNTPRKAVTCPAPVPASASSSATTAGG